MNQTSSDPLVAEPSQNCQLLGTFGLIVQMILGVLSFMVLVGNLIIPIISPLVKRNIERPKRLWKVFSMDTSKQVFSQLLQHSLNVTIAIVISETKEGDACLWYFITFMMDSTIGVSFCYLGLMSFEKLFESRGITVQHNFMIQFNQKFKTGNYYEIIYPKISTYSISSVNSAVTQIQKTKPKVVIDYQVFFMQFMLWLFIVLCSKVCLYFLQILTSNWLYTAASWIFTPINGDPEMELIVIMVAIPLITNSIIFWVQDNFLKKTDIKRMERDLLMGVIYENESPAQANEVEIEFQQIGVNRDEQKKINGDQVVMEQKGIIY